MMDAYERLPKELKQRQDDPTKPSVQVYREQPSRRGGGVGTWQSSTRGGAHPGAAGYRSGGASDSEGGRGAFRGGRGGRGRGSERGGRGPRGGGRGGFNKGASEGASPATGGGESKTAPSGGES